jgi:hypothetical protein
MTADSSNSQALPAGMRAVEEARSNLLQCTWLLETGSSGFATGQAALWARKKMSWDIGLKLL